MSVIPTSLITDGVLNAEGCSLINCPSTSGVAASASALQSTRLDLTGSPGTSYDIGTSTRASVVMPSGQSTIGITSSLFTSNTSLFLTMRGLTIDSSFPQLVVDYTSVATHVLNIVSTGMAAQNYTIDVLVVNNPS